MMTNETLLGAELRRWRRAARLKQGAIAEALGVDQATVSRWERGRQLPNADVETRLIYLIGSLAAAAP